MNVDMIIYQNIERLIEEYGLSERICIDRCGLSRNFFCSHRNGTSKHFKVCDIVNIAVFFDVTMDYLCDYKNTRKDFFIPKYTMKGYDEKRLIAAFKSLDPQGKFNVTEQVNKELEEMHKRARQNKNKNKEKNL